MHSARKQVSGQIDTDVTENLASEERRASPPIIWTFQLSIDILQSR